MKVRERGNPVLHFLDEYGGIPAVRFFGILRRKHQLPKHLRSIGLLKTGGIGDTVLLGGVIADLRESFPCASIVLFCSQSNFEIACMIDGVDLVVALPILNPVASWRAVRSISLDVLLDFGHWSRLEALLALLSRAKFTVGFRTAGQNRHYGFDLSVDHSSKVHELENYRQLVGVLGINTKSRPALRVPAAEVFSGLDYVVLHPWPGGIRSELKRWPKAYWVQLAESLSNRGLDLVITGGPSDRQRNEELIASFPLKVRCRTHNTAGLSLEKNCAMLARSRLVVCVNTGMMHIAAALGRPLVALHGPTSSRRWGPVSDNAVIINSPLAECGYLNLGWEYPDSPPKCMEAITYEVVRDACLAKLDEGSQSGSDDPQAAAAGRTDSQIVGRCD